MELMDYCIFYRLGTARRVWNVPIFFHFASLGAAQELIRDGLRFIGVVKTFSQACLSILELTQRGDFSGLDTMDENYHVRFCLDGPRP